ncbi:hypothetical protein MKX01_013351 [Papaver californicum]|nr:hypothetical protein MKX01_013351 [Papaver californicum]
MGSLDAKPAETQEVGTKDQAQLWNIIFGFADSLVLRCKTCNARAVDKVYSLKPLGTLLLRDAERSMVPMMLGMTQQDFMVPWYFMKEGLENESTTAFEKGMGTNIWTYLEGHPDQKTRLLTKTLIEDCRDTFKSLDSLVDIGGGNGTTIKAIYEAFPHIKCTLYDIPHVIANSHDHPSIERAPDDMFKSVPSSQAILLKMIFHDWTDEERVNILKKCKEAIPKETGKVSIVDVALEEESKHELTKTRLSLDIDMLVNTSGRERTADDWENLLKRAGFQSHKIRPSRYPVCH